MNKLPNGWYVPENEQKVTSVLVRDSNIDNPSYEQKYRDYILQHIPNKRTFIDVGANVGIWTRPFTDKFDKIIAYEPSLANLECLKLNIDKKVDIRDYALADFEGEFDFHVGKKNCGDSKLSRNPEKSDYKVAVKMIDNENLTNVDLIKIDVQGWELNVLKGAETIIKRDKPWLIWEINDDVDICCNFMEELGYEMLHLKSKRVFLWAPLEGENKPAENLFGRWLGLGPYVDRLVVK